MSQSPYGSPYGPPPQQPDRGLPAPVDPYQPAGQPGYEPGYPASPGYPSYPEPSQYPEPNPYPSTGYPNYGEPSYQQPGYYAPQSAPPAQPQYGGPQYGGPGYPGGPAYPPSAPQGGGGGRTLVWVLVGVLALVVILGGLGVAFVLTKGNTNKPTANGTTAPAPTPTGTGGGQSASSAPSPGATHTGDLRTYLIAAPSGSRPWPKPLGTDRALTLDQASNLSSDPAKRKEMLQKYNFVDGAVQCWIAANNTNVVDVRLYHFDNANDASAFFGDNLDATGQGYTADNTADVTGVPGAKSFADPKVDAQGFVSIIDIGLKGDVVFVVSIAEKAAKVDLTVPAGLMQQQYQKL